ncbi:uncharacterized protein LOC110974941 [Acanthaster planci]|uniref:Uncharacterized protein LOC110974941 n=1 Tax=Acanthaster planci TaxID=133434 RepID=A0A8B7XRJ8_ACAPL|nr:uncharacterized protein LOC110974941 [Acanthaster planci]
MNIILTVILSAVVLGRCGVNAQCYNCTYIDFGQATSGPKGCIDPFMPSGIDQVPCSGQCMKATVVFKASQYSPAWTSTTRTCAKPGEPCVELEGFTIESTTSSVWCCDGASCNGQGTVGFSVPLTVFSMLTAALLFC